MVKDASFDGVAIGVLGERIVKPTPFFSRNHRKRWQGPTTQIATALAGPKWVRFVRLPHALVDTLIEGCEPTNHGESYSPNPRP